MTMKIEERRGRQYGPKGGRMLFSVRGTLDEAEAINAVVGGSSPPAPMTWGELTRKDYSAREIGFKGWEIDIDFASSAIEVLPGVTQWSYSTDGGTIVQKFLEEAGLNRVFYWDDSKYEEAPELGLAIGVNSDLSIEGVEKIVSRMQAEARTRMSSGQVTAAFLAQVQALTGTVCNSDFHIWEKGEALFAGARIQQVNALEWDASFLFLGSPNRTGLKIGSVSDIDKEGWEYLWTYVTAKTEPVTEGNLASPEARGIYVDTIYKKANFSLLGIPS